MVMPSVGWICNGLRVISSASHAFIVRNRKKTDLKLFMMKKTK